MSSFLFSSPPPSSPPQFFLRSSPTRSPVHSPSSRPPSRFASLVARPMSSPTKIREARRQSYRDHMRQVRETCAFEARGGSERIVTDLLIAEHKQWIADLEKEGSQFLPSPEEEEALFKELHGISLGLAKPPQLESIPNLQPPDPSDEMMLEEYLEAEADQAKQYEQSIEYYLQLEQANNQDTPMAE